MRYAADIQFSAGCVYDLWKRDHGGHLSCFMYQFDEKIFLHDIGIHENVAVLCASAVLLDGFHTLLFVQVQDIAVQESFLCVVHRVIQKSNVRA